MIMRAAFLSMFMLAGCANAQTPSSSSSHYVAMGSSFAAGPGLGATKPDTPARCSRTSANYATILANRLELTLSDEGCSGATTEHILHRWGELPAQIDAVTAQTSLVTVTIGGNDLNYVDALFAASCRVNGQTNSSGPQFSCGAPAVPVEQAYQDVEANMREIARQVHERAPGAMLIFVDYLTLVPDQPCDAAQLLPEDAKITREIGSRLAEITKRVALEANAELIEASALSSQHSPCSDRPWTLGFPSESSSNQGAPWRPNQAGMQMLADEVEKLLKKS